MRDPRVQAALYTESRGLTIVRELGGGFDGAVFATDRATAIKAFIRTELFHYELAVYQRLRGLSLNQLHGFAIPELLDSDDMIAVIEMTIVSPPFVLDFAGARLDRKTDYDQAILDEWKAEKQEQFEDDWPQVQRLIWAFERYGIFLNDVHPGNVMCR